MTQSITQLRLGAGPFSVNAYLVKTDACDVLVDTGMRSQRRLLPRLLQAEGCAPDALSLILLTHGDLDHIGNAAYLRDAYSAPIAMNEGDIGMSRDSDMFFARQSGDRVLRALLRVAFRLSEADRFVPDIPLAEDTDLSEYGLRGVKILQVPGHSAGSMALLFEHGGLICGDLLENRKTPRLGSIMDDVPAAKRSMERLRELGPGMVYPGHGMPFPFSELGGVA